MNNRISLKSKIKNIIRIIFQLRKLINNPAPIYTTRTNGIRLHLGSGNVNLQGWINIDARKDSHIHIIEKDFKLETFADNSISEIYLSHVIEHFTFEEINKLMDIFKRKLMKKGILRVSVPDFDSLIKIYQSSSNNIEKVEPILLGGQEHIYNFHKSIFNKKKLISLFKIHGFKSIKEWDTKEIFGSSVGDYSDQKIKIARNYIPISLNISGEFK